MFNILKEEASRAHTQSVEHPNKDITQQIDNSHHSFTKRIIYLAIHSHIDQFQNYYLSTSFSLRQKEVIFSAIALLCNQLQFKSKGRNLISKLLQIENNNIQVVQLIPMHLYKDLTFSNGKGLQKKYNRMYTKAFYQNQRIKLLNESSKGYSQILLILCLFFENSKINYSKEQTWQKLMIVVGKYNLDMDRITDVILEYAAANLEHVKVSQLFDLLSACNSPNIIHLIVLKITNFQRTNLKEIQYCGELEQIIEKSTQELYKLHLYHYNPLYVKLLCKFISHKPSNLSLVLANVRHCTSAQLKQIQFQKIILSQQMTEQIFVSSMPNMSEKQLKQLDNKQRKYLLGQVFYCIKLCMMVEYIKDNNFIQFRQLYTEFASYKMDPIICMPLVRQICLLIQWIIDPVYNKIGYRKFFKGFPIHVQSTAKAYGYFKQAHEIDIRLFKNISQLLNIIKIYVGFKRSTYIKLCKLFAKILQYYQDIGFKQCIKDIILNNLIGGVAVQKEMPVMSIELYHLLQRFSQEQRFSIYLFYYSDIVGNYPYLNYHFQKISVKSNSLINKITAQNPRKEIMTSLIKYQYNKFFQSSYIIKKRILSLINDQDSIVFVKIINKAPKISKDLMLFLIFGEIINNKQDFTQKILQKNQKSFNILNYFMYELLLQGNLYDKKKEFDFLSSYILIELRQNTGEQMMMAVKMLSYLLQKVYPTQTDYNFNKENHDFYMSGFYMKLDMRNLIQPFIQCSHVRSQLMNSLCQKVAFQEYKYPEQRQDNKESQEKHSVLYILISLINSHIKKIQQTKWDSLHTMGFLLDEFNALMYKLCKFYYCQLYVQKEELSKINIEEVHITQAEFQHLIVQQKVPLLVGLILFKSLRKYNPVSPYKTFKKIAVAFKNIWQSRMKEMLFKGESKYIRQHFRHLPQDKLTTFLQSQLFLNFWLGEIENLSDLNLKYTAKINQYRQILANKEGKNTKSTKELQMLKVNNKNKHLLSYNLLSLEQLYCNEQYKSYHDNYKLYSKGYEIINKFTITNNLLQKNKDHDEVQFSIFIDMLIVHCLLPRLLLDSDQAIYCSRYVIKIIKQNKLVLKKAITMVCNIIEAVVHYLPFSTERQTIKSISLFTVDLLSIFKDWDNPVKFKTALENSFSLEKYNEKRYEKLKEYISVFIANITQVIVSIKHDAYLIKNCLHFLQKCNTIPICLQQGEEILTYLTLLAKTQDDNLKLSLIRMSQIVTHRMKNISYIKPKISQKELKKLNMNRLAKEVPLAVAKAKIYIDEDKEDKHSRFYDNIY